MIGFEMVKKQTFIKKKPENTKHENTIDTSGINEQTTTI